MSNVVRPAFGKHIPFTIINGQGFCGLAACRVVAGLTVEQVDALRPVLDIRVRDPDGRGDREFVSAPGMYRMLMDATSDNGQYRTWVSEEVMPALDRDGGYIMADCDIASVRNGPASRRD